MKTFQLKPDFYNLIEPLDQFCKVITLFSYVPILCLLLKVLWFAYLHYPYRYTIMRWTLYIVLRVIVMFFVVDFWEYIYKFEFKPSLLLSMFSLQNKVSFALQTGYHLVDFITYLIYSRRFYLHLKSRELEAKFFMSRKDYIQRKYIRRHFKIATILVAISFTFNTLGLINTDIANYCKFPLTQHQRLQGTNVFMCFSNNYMLYM